MVRYDDRKDVCLHNELLINLGTGEVMGDKLDYSLLRRRGIWQKEASGRTLSQQTGNSSRCCDEIVSHAIGGANATHLPFRNEKLLCALFNTSLSK